MIPLPEPPLLVENIAERAPFVQVQHRVALASLLSSIQLHRRPSLVRKIRFVRFKYAGSPLLLAVRGCARSPYAVGKGRECLCLADRPSAGCLRAAVQVCVCSLNCELLAHRGKVGREEAIPVLLHQPVASFLRSSATRASRGAQDASPRHLAWASVTRLPGVAHSWRVWAP